MGGIFFDDLMADVNVLIIGDYDTEKYKFCAKKRTDIKFIKPDAINSIYDLWKSNPDELDSSILDDYICPVFDNLSICLARLSNAEDDIYCRSYITSLIEKCNGTPTESLMMSTSFVISAKQAGRRCEKAVEWGIPVVHPRWVIDCVRRGAILEHQYYDINKIEPDKLGKGSCVVWDQLPTNGIDLYSITNPIFLKSRSMSLRAGSIRAVKKSVDDGMLFSGLEFLTYGFTESQMKKLVSVINKYGGEIVQEYESTVTHLLIPSSMSFKSLPMRFKDLIDAKRLAVVNEWLVERSVYYKKLKFDSWSIPRNYTHMDFKLRISVTGFSGVELLHISKLIDMLGCELVEKFQQSCDLLVANLHLLGLTRSNSPKLYKYKYADIVSCHPTQKLAVKPTKVKIAAAKKWGVPVISMAYLWQITEQGTLPQLMDYRWCIFGPRNSRPAHNFMEYARDATGGTFQTQKPASKADPPKRSSKPLSTKLPSPKKPNNRKWPRLVGTAAESQLRVPDDSPPHTPTKRRKVAPLEETPSIGWDISPPIFK